MGKISDEVDAIKPDPTERIREDIRETEAEITDTLHTIEERFTPSHLRHEAKERLKHYSVVSYVKVTEACRRRPVVVAAIGAASLLLVGLAVRRPRKRRKFLERGAALYEALPKRAKKKPSEDLKRYVTIGRLAVAVASALGTILMRSREASGEYQAHRAGQKGMFPATVK